MREPRSRIYPFFVAFWGLLHSILKNKRGKFSGAMPPNPKLPTIPKGAFSCCACS